MSGLDKRLLAPVDAAWLNMDSPENPMVITGLLRVSGLDGDALASFLRQSWLDLPRFRARPVSLGGTWWWQPQAELSLEEHLVCCDRVLADEAALSDQLALCQSETLPGDRPLWKFWHFPMADGDHAVVVRLHHCYADGITLVRLFDDLTTDSPHEAPAPAPAGEEHPPWQDSLLAWLQSRFAALGSTQDLGEALERLSQHGGRLLKELGELLLQPADTPSSLKGPLSGDKRCAWSAPVPLEAIKSRARARGCTLNDVLLACVATALQKQLLRAGDDLHDRRLQAAMPVDVRAVLPPALLPAAGGLGNLFGTVFVPLPMDAESLLERVFRIKHETRRLKHSWQPGLSWCLLGGLGYLPRQWQLPLVAHITGRASAVVSNVPGSRSLRFLVGCPVRQHLFWVPQSGNIGLGISVISYHGKVQFGVQSDAAVLADPRPLLEDCLTALREFEQGEL
ncbi:MAG: WS/DGAT domain-containing protein [Oleiphilaceae bacterium]|nr:WS/DGAT domain-containing protein [Oleiphilaceae bacterium]